jgi:Ser/Thr protein kinase RdoA (MazF antagonist)
VVARVTRIHHLYRPVETLAAAVAAARSIKSLQSPTDLVEAGPHVLADGRYVTFWTYVDRPPAAPAEAGRALRALHESAKSFDGRLRSYDPRPEARRIAELVDKDTAAVLRAAAERLTAPDLPLQPIHGDAHLANVLRGGLWIDADDVCRGPREWDLACLRHRWIFASELENETKEAFAAYGQHEETALDQLDALVMLFIAAGGSLAPLVGEEIGPRGRRRLEWLRRRVG